MQAPILSRRVVTRPRQGRIKVRKVKASVRTGWTICSLSLCSLVVWRGKYKWRCTSPDLSALATFQLPLHLLPSPLPVCQHAGRKQQSYFSTSLFLSTNRCLTTKALNIGVQSSGSSVLYRSMTPVSETLCGFPTSGPGLLGSGSRLAPPSAA